MGAETRPRLASTGSYGWGARTSLGGLERMASFPYGRPQAEETGEGAGEEAGERREGESGRFSPPPECIVPLDSLAEAVNSAGTLDFVGSATRPHGGDHLSQVDLIICLGGDGTLLWASGLFGGAMPPVVSFSMGSLGFLTPFAFDEHRTRLDQVIASLCSSSLVTSQFVIRPAINDSSSI